MKYQLKIRAEIQEVQDDGHGPRVNYSNTFVIEETKMLGETDFTGLTRVLGHLHAAMISAGEEG